MNVQSSKFLILCNANLYLQDVFILQLISTFISRWCLQFEMLPLIFGYKKYLKYRLAYPIQSLYWLNILRWISLWDIISSNYTVLLYAEDPAALWLAELDTRALDLFFFWLAKHTSAIFLKVPSTSSLYIYHVFKRNVSKVSIQNREMRRVSCSQAQRSLPLPLWRSSH